MRLLVALLLAQAVRVPQVKAVIDRAKAARIGTFRPTAALAPCHCDALTPVATAGQVIVLAPDATPIADHDVVVIQPYLGLAVPAKLAAGKIALPYFLADGRDDDDGVLVLPAPASVVFVTPTKSDLDGIRKALLENEVLSHVKRSVDHLEVGAVDIDGDGHADFASTYGCNAWADGQCQSKGQFFLASLGTSWVEIE